MDWLSLRRPDFDFWTGMTTRWRDMDSLGHINHAAYLTYMESARVDVYRKLGYSGIRKEQEESTILGSMEVNYYFQVKHPVELEIGHRICRAGSKSFDMLAAVFIIDKTEPVCTTLFKMVAYSYIKGKTIPLPDPIRNNCRPI